MLSDKELKALDIWTKYHKRDIESDFEDSFKILDKNSLLKRRFSAIELLKSLVMTY